MSDSDFNSVRVIRDGEMPGVIGTSPSSWLRMKREGDHPPITMLSERQKGYRLCDVKEWLDAKREAV